MALLVSPYRSDMGAGYLRGYVPGRLPRTVRARWARCRRASSICQISETRPATGPCSEKRCGPARRPGVGASRVVLRAATAVRNTAPPRSERGSLTCASRSHRTAVHSVSPLSTPVSADWRRRAEQVHDHRRVCWTAGLRLAPAAQTDDPALSRHGSPSILVLNRLVSARGRPTRLDDSLAASQRRAALND